MENTAPPQTQQEKTLSSTEACIMFINIGVGVLIVTVAYSVYNLGIILGTLSLGFGITALLQGGHVYARLVIITRAYN